LESLKTIIYRYRTVSDYGGSDNSTHPSRNSFGYDGLAAGPPPLPNRMPASVRGMPGERQCLGDSAFNVCAEKMTIPRKPNLILSKVFPGTAQQFRAQMQRLFARSSEVFGSELFSDRRLAHLALERGTVFGLCFRELPQLASTSEAQPKTPDTDRQDERLDVTPPTRSTWSVYMFRRKRCVSSADDLLEPRPLSVSHIVESSYPRFQVVNEYYEYIEKEQGFAGIEAYEQRGGTRIDFYDAYDPIAAMDWGLPPVAMPIGPAFAEFCEWVVREIWGELQPVRVRLHVEDIDSFSQVRRVGPKQVSNLLSDGWLDLREDRVQTAIEMIVSVPFHKEDWGGEENDLYTANVVLAGERVPTAFALKGRGTPKHTLQIRDCGQNGDQLVRLFQSPAELFIVQFVGEISENVVKDVESKALLLRAQGKRAWYCIINGQDTARLLRAYGIL
jgi:hypothetical protein